MSDLLQQFLIESRELIESATDGLAILEQSPHDSEQFDAVLRTLHTLKGGAGIVEFGAMERTMHAAEGVLSAARAGRRPMTAARFAQCVACLDQALQWLDTLEHTGALPDDAARQADQIINVLGLSAEDGSAVSDGGPRGLASTTWLEELAGRHPDVRARAAAAVRFRPAADSFHRLEDPLARMLSMPGLLALDCAANSAWSGLDTLDPFVCNLTLTALSAAPIADLLAHLRGHTGECEILPLTAVHMIEAGERPLPAAAAAAVDVIKAQGALLELTTPQDFAGRVGSAGLVASNALRFCGRVAEAQLIFGATERSLHEHSVEPLQRALADLFNPRPALPARSPDSPRPSNAAARTVRVDAARVDALVRLVGELTVVKNSMGHIARLAMTADPSLPQVLKDRHLTLERLVSELQRSVLAMRVRPLRAVLQRLPRVIREMSASMGKPVRLTIEGDDTEADQTIVEMLFEPLLHIVRNAIDHGVENPKDRARSGKPLTASLRIRVERRADQVLVEVSDDGSGIDIVRVREIARKRGIVTEEQLRTMSDPETINLVFAPGFSTASKVTQLSGRGVGMDAVRKAVERVGGKASVASAIGQGTTVTLSLPFSVMMTRIMTIEAGGQIFGLPVEVIVETAKIAQTAIAQVGSAQAVVLRDRTVPLIDLAAILGLSSPSPVGPMATVVVVTANGELGAIRVDRVLERMDLILEPLDGLLAGTPGISGTTLLGDGRVLLVLDIGEML